jgi:hypothetical protein
MTTETISLQAFIDQNGITATVKPGPVNPYMDMAGMNHYVVTFQRDGQTLSTPFSTGASWDRDPDATDALDCLASDAAGVESANGFEAWAGDYGYDPDSRADERTYNALVKGAEELKTFLGDDLFEILLYNTQRQ